VRPGSAGADPGPGEYYGAPTAAAPEAPTQFGLGDYPPPEIDALNDVHDFSPVDRAPTAGRAGSGSRSRLHEEAEQDDARPRRGSMRGTTGGRRSGSGRKRHGKKLWVGVGAGAAAVVAIVVAAVMVLGSGSSGPQHVLVTPAKLGSWTKSASLAKQMDVTALEKNIITQSSGSASNLVSAVYQDGSTTVGGATPQVLLFIGGKLTGASPVTALKEFTAKFSDVRPASVGSFDGEAACVDGPVTANGTTAVCAWFDDDTFGELVSANMSVTELASEMHAFRPSLELVAK
jgi:hypothetical protein